MKKETLQADVAVIGGGQAGVCAALAAAQEGRVTVLVTDRPVLGGNASSECGVPPHGADAIGHNRNCRDTGLLEEMRLEYYLRRSPWSDSRQHWDSILMDACLEQPNLTVLTQTVIFSCDVRDGVVLSVTGYSRTEETLREIRAAQFVDDTGDGAIAAMAGASFRWGRESRDEFGELFLGRETADNKTLGSTVYGWAVKRDRPVSFKPPAWAVDYSTCDDLSHRPHTKDHIFPAVTSSEDQNSIQMFWWIEWGGHLNVIEDQHEIYRHLLSELFGIWDHLKNHCEGPTRQALESFELVRWSSFPLRRESRRIEGDYMMTEEDLLRPKLFEDRVGYGGWPPDDHPPEGLSSTESACDQVFLHEPYSVPYRSLFARDLENLFLAGRCLSATHVALSSVRLMNTLGILGEAVGVAAAMCCELGTSPRGLHDAHMSSLQQRLLDRDLYIIDMPSRNPKNLVSRARLEASSSLPLVCGELLGYLDLRRDTVIQAPITTDGITAIDIYLRSETNEELDWRVLLGTKTADPGQGVPAAEGTLSVHAGASWYSLEIPPLSPEKDCLLFLVLKSAPGISWGYATEQFHTRWGVRFEEEPSFQNYHGRARSAPTTNPWLFVNHHGRLPDELVSWLKEKPGLKVHGKLYATPLFRITPEPHPYGPANVANGVTRAEDTPNVWISGEESADPVLTCRWDSPVLLSRVEIIFDSQLDYSDQMYGFPRREKDFSIPAVIEELVRDYRIEVESPEGWITVEHITDNGRRRRIHTLPQPMNTRGMRIVVEKTWGSRSARIYEVRAF